MKYYLINEQDLDEYYWELEKIVLEIVDKIKEKEIVEKSEEGE